LTSPDFTGLLESRRIRIGSDGRGPIFDNISVERLWRTVSEARQRLAGFFQFNNTQKSYEALGYRTPHEAHVRLITCYLIEYAEDWETEPPSFREENIMGSLELAMSQAVN